MVISIQALQSAHNISTFDCGVEVLNQWLRNTAGQHGRKGISRTFVAVDNGKPNEVLGFYCLTVAEAEGAALPEPLRKKLPQKVPSVLLGRLARSVTMRGQGLGEKLLVDALTRIVATSEHVGIAAIFVDAKDDHAAEFYKNFGFLPLPDNPNRLVMVTGTARGVAK